MAFRWVAALMLALGAGLVPVRAHTGAPDLETAFARIGELATAPRQSGEWAVADSVSSGSPAPALLLARYEATGWRAITAGDPAFDVWLRALPDDLVAPADREFFRPALVPALRSPTAAITNTAQGFRLPWPNGWNAFMTQGPFGPFSHGGYWAIDLVLPTTGGLTSTVTAAKAGVVMYVKDISTVGGVGTGFSGYSNGVVIRHGPDEYSWYWHLAARSVPDDIQPGRPVDAGAVIGWMGSTGYSSGPHLHFMVTRGFVMTGCSSVTGCPTRETRANTAPWNREIVPVDFDEVADESRWNGCNSRSSCGLLPPSGNRLLPEEGVVLHWSPGFTGAAWKQREAYTDDVPRWLAGRIRSLSMPDAWWARLYAEPGAQGSATDVFTSSTPISSPVSMRVSAAISVTKRLRNDLSVAWPYLLGSSDTRALGLRYNGQQAATLPCVWHTAQLEPGRHTVSWQFQPRPGEAPVPVAHRSPFETPDCLGTSIEPTGPPPTSTACLAPADAYEPDNGVFLSDGDAQVRNTHTPGDPDWVTISVTTGMRYRIATTGLEPDADTVLTLFSADGQTQLAQSDDAEGYASQIDFRPVQAAFYRVRVNPWDPGISGCGTGYTLTLRVAVAREVYLPVAQK
jgi:murein DD-endopeptidase MepM/ murein hydrolase activator NlpD